METKKCLECNETKSVTEFHKGSNGAKYNPRCKPCRKYKAAKHYKENWFHKFAIGKISWSKINNIECDLDGDYLKEIYTTLCPIYKVPFSKSEGKGHRHYPTLDRLDPSKGYVRGNVVWISHRANRIKYDADVEELRLIADWLEGATTIPKGSTLK